MPAYVDNLEIVTRYMLSSEECKKLVQFKLNIDKQGIQDVEYRETEKLQTKSELPSKCE